MFGYPFRRYEKERVERLNTMSPNMDGSEFSENHSRGASIIGGLFLFFFGLPFTCVPFLMFYGAGLSLDGESLFMGMFSIPFLLAGLFVQGLGLTSIYSGVSGKNMFPNMDEDETNMDQQAREVNATYPSYDELQRQIHSQQDPLAQTPSSENDPEATSEAEELPNGAFWSLPDQGELQD